MSWIAHCDSQSVFGNACNTIASPTKNFLAFATLLQVPQKTFWRLRRSRKFRRIYRDVCASCASSAAFSETFAQAAQVAQHLPRRLRRLRKFRRICRDVCAGCASSAAFAEVFAGVPQVSRKTFWRLQERCKHFQKRFGPRMTFVEALCLHRTHVNRKRVPTLGHVRLSNRQLEP